VFNVKSKHFRREFCKFLAGQKISHVIFTCNNNWCSQHSAHHTSNALKVGYSLRNRMTVFRYLWFIYVWISSYREFITMHHTYIYEFLEYFIVVALRNCLFLMYYYSTVFFIGITHCGCKIFYVNTFQELVKLVMLISLRSRQRFDKYMKSRVVLIRRNIYHIWKLFAY